MNTVPDGEVPGAFKSSTSVGRITPEADFPIFDVTTKPASFNLGETVVSKDANGIVQSQVLKSGYVTLLGSRRFLRNSVITGEVSRTTATIFNNTVFTSSYNVSSSSIVKEGWKDNLGLIINKELLIVIIINSSHTHFNQKYSMIHGMNQYLL